MSLKRFLNVLGLPVDYDPGDDNDIERLRSRARRLTSALQKNYQALIRRRVRIEKLRQRIIDAEANIADRGRRLLLQREVHYRQLVDHVRQMRQKSVALQKKIHTLENS